MKSNHNNITRVGSNNCTESQNYDGIDSSIFDFDLTINNDRSDTDTLFNDNSTAINSSENLSSSNQSPVNKLANRLFMNT